MNTLLVITTRKSGKIAVPLMQGLSRAGENWGCFFTNDGVELIKETACQEAIKSAQRVVVCEHSWDTLVVDTRCPVELGSQTINSSMMTEVDRVISL
jgi:hypothetical protein|tara:strand:+ start:139 stop:429 length:291 start_codon:yes stop_codon:yes gene_type:complete